MKRNIPQKSIHRKPIIAEAKAPSPNAAHQTKLKNEERLQAIDRRIARRRSFYLAVIVVFIMMSTILLIVRVMSKNAPKPQFLFIQEGSIEHTISSDALIIRQEQIVQAPVEGMVKPLIKEGNKVSFGQTVAVMIDQISETSINELRNCEQQIATLQIDLMNQGKGLGARGIYDESDQELSEMIDLIRQESVRNILNNTESLKSTIRVIMERRNNRLQSVDFQDARLTELKKQKDVLEEKIGLATGTLTAKHPGIVSYHLDGNEKELTPEMIESLSVERYEQLIKSTNMQLTTGIILQASEPAFRITDGIFQYLVLSIPAEFLPSFSAGSVHTIRAALMGTDIKNCTVVAVNLYQDRCLVVFRTDMQLGKLLNRRTFEAAMIVRSTRGLRVPLSAILDFNEAAASGYVYIIQGGYVRKAGIQIIDYDREYAIIKPDEASDYKPKLYGYLVKNPLAVREGESIGGIR